MPSGLVQFCFLWNNLLVEITPSTKVNVWKHIYCIFYLFRLTFFHFSLFTTLFLSLLLSPSSFISFFVSIKWPRTKFALCTLFVNIIFVSVAQYWQRNESLWPDTPYTGKCLTELTRKCRNWPTITRNVKLPLQTVWIAMIFLYLSKILRASIFFCLADWNISIILGNEPLSTVRRNLIAGSALMLISIERKENWANKAKKTESHS